MKKTQALLLIILTLAITLSSRAILDRLTLPSSAHAQRAQATRTVETPKWEYCSLLSRLNHRSDYGRNTSYATIHYFESSGIRAETVEEIPVQTKDYSSSAATIAKAIAKLGDEGWEMCGDTNVNQYPEWIYFKRPKK